VEATQYKYLYAEARAIRQEMRQTCSRSGGTLASAGASKYSNIRHDSYEENGFLYLPSREHITVNPVENANFDSVFF
jgi:hypothetical protein